MSFDKDAFEEQVITDMREHGGVISSGPMAGTRLLVLTTTGAKTGQRRRALLFFSKDGADYVIAGTASGATRDPRGSSTSKPTRRRRSRWMAGSSKPRPRSPKGQSAIDFGSSTSRSSHNWARMRNRPGERSRWCV